jgi:hypothetical protein
VSEGCYRRFFVNTERRFPARLSRHSLTIRSVASEIGYCLPDLRANPDGLLARRSFMNVAAMTAPESLLEEAEASTLYSVCFFERDWIVPEVQFLEAENDSDALVFARSMRPGMTREIWDRHRLVRVLPPGW